MSPTTVELGRNINYSDKAGKYIVMTWVNGKEKAHECDTRALAYRRMEALQANGYHYIDSRKDTTI